MDTAGKVVLPKSMFKYIFEKAKSGEFKPKCSVCSGVNGLVPCSNGNTCKTWQHKRCAYDKTENPKCNICFIYQGIDEDNELPSIRAKIGIGLGGRKE